MYAAFSITASVNDNLSFNLSISLSACLKFLSTDEWACDLLSHVLILSNDCFIADESGLPVASLFTAPITVDNPISCIVIEVPVPVLLLSTPSLAKDLHSGPLASLPSDNTIPHVLQKTSPELSSVISVLLLHEGHLCSLDDFNKL